MQVTSKLSPVGNIFHITWSCCRIDRLDFGFVPERAGFISAVYPTLNSQNLDVVSQNLDFRDNYLEMSTQKLDFDSETELFNFEKRKFYSGLIGKVEVSSSRGPLA